MDTAAFHRVTRYFAALPNGWLSHPECECKATLYREALAALPSPLDTTGLDPLLASYVTDPPPMTSWVPEVVSSAIYLAIADRVHKDDERFLGWIEDFSVRVFRSPIYRVLMAVASPERLARGGERRWANFHSGTDYSLVIGDNGSEGRITFPPNLFDRLVFRGHLRGIQAAYRASGAPNAIVELDEMTATEARFHTTWYPEKVSRRR